MTVGLVIVSHSARLAEGVAELAGQMAQDKVAIKLKKGNNTVLLKVANGVNPHGFYFTVLSKDEVKTK